MGLWVAFVFVLGVFALIGWSVYSTYRRSSAPVETLDAIDILLALATWIGLPFAIGSWFGPGEAAVAVGFALVVGAGVGMAWLRRRLWPQTVVPFDSRNAALRSAAVFSALAAPLAVVFGAAAATLEQSRAVLWSFRLTAAGLVLLAGWLHSFELRRPLPRGAADADPIDAAPRPLSATSALLQRLWFFALGVLLLATAGYSFLGAWKDWRLERALDTGSVRTEALVTSCLDESRYGDRIAYEFTVLAAESGGPVRTVTGAGNASCYPAGRRIPIRYLVADPLQSQIDRPWPWLELLSLGFTATLIGLSLFSLRPRADRRR